MNIAKIKPRDLSVSAVFEQPQYFDWWERNDWEVVHTDEGDFDDSFDYEYEEPMMNYLYPLPEFEKIMRTNGWDEVQVARELRRTVPLCLVLFEDGEYALALTGAGMDFSWDICEAYIRCGYLPPVYFCNLPDFAGQRLTPTRRKIISCCRRSIKWAENYSQNAKRGLRFLMKKMKEKR